MVEGYFRITNHDLSFCGVCLSLLKKTKQYGSKMRGM